MKEDEFRRWQLERHIPAGRFGRPEEVANSARWLLSERSSYVNGAVFGVQGGEFAGLRPPRLP